MFETSFHLIFWGRHPSSSGGVGYRWNVIDNLPMLYLVKKKHGNTQHDDSREVQKELGNWLISQDELFNCYAFLCCSADLLIGHQRLFGSLGIVCGQCTRKKSHHVWVMWPGNVTSQYTVNFVISSENWFFYVDPGEFDVAELWLKAIKWWKFGQ